MARLIGFAWNKTVGDVSAFESTGILSFKPKQSTWIFVLHFWCQRNYNFYSNSISKYGSRFCALYFSNQLSNSAEPSFSTLNNILNSVTSPEELTSFRLCKSCPIPKIPRKYSIEQIFFIAEEVTYIEEERKKQRGNKIKQQRNLNCKHYQYFRSRRAGNAEKGANYEYIDIHKKETAEDCDTKWCCWENYLQTTNENVWIEFVSCRNWLHEFCCPYKDKDFDCGRKLLREKNAFCRRSIESSSLKLRLLSSLISNIVSLWYFFYSDVDIPLLRRLKFNRFHILCLFLEFTWYFRRHASFRT